MSTHFLRRFLGLALLCWQSSVFAQSLQPVSTVDPALGAPSGGNGDSWAPILSPDGRYVLFASTAESLILTTNHTTIPALIPATLNVYLRDRLTKQTTLVSVNLTGNGGGNGDSLPIALSTNGQYALFESSASDLVPGDTNAATDVFLRDLSANSTVLVSANSNGVAGSGAAHGSTMTPDGRYVAFVSSANDLVAADTNRIPDIFCRDLQTGSTVLVSSGAVSTNSNLPIGSSESPMITPDGRFVAFYSTATNLVAGVPPGGDVYVRDLVNSTTAWASAGARAAVSNAFHSASAVSYNQVISDDGHYVVFEASPPLGYAGLILRYGVSSGTTELIHTNAAAAIGAFEDFRSLEITPDGQKSVFVANTNDYSTTCVQLWDATTGDCVLISGDLDGQVAASSTCDWPSVDPNGRFIAFQSSNPNLTTNSVAGDYHLYRRDLVSGGITLIDADTNGIGSDISPATVPSMSNDGSLVAFDCSDGNLVPNDRNKDSDVFVRNVTAADTELISAHDPKLPTVTANGETFLASASVTTDGRYIAFASEADNLTANDTNDFRDVFVRDMIAGTTLLVSGGTNGSSGDGLSTDPAISPDGQFVAFTSSADNLVAGDNNNSQDVFLRDLGRGETMLVSYNSVGTGPGAKASYSPKISSGGRYVLYRSQAANLALGTFTGENLFLRDMQAATNYALSKSGVGLAAMTPDGNYVAYGTSSLTPSLYVWNSASATQVYTNTTGPVFGLAINADGTRVAMGASAGLYVVDLAAGTSRLVEANTYGFSSLGLSHDGRWLTCLKKLTSSAATQVYLYDLQTGTNVLVSHAATPSQSPNGGSDSCVISPDGRLVAYRSAASNLVTGDLNGVPDIFLYDSRSGVNTLLSSAPLSQTSGNNRSLTPVFSGDGKMVCYVSWASDLVPLDFNQSSDVFAFTLLSVEILPSSTSGQGPWIAWPYTPGKTYKVQFTDSLTTPSWSDLSGVPTNSANRAYLQDPAPSGGRFYRVVSE